jgi:hypothetical protein
MTTTVDNYQDVLDSRDIEERISTLEELRDAAAEGSMDPMEENESEELAALIELRDEAQGYSEDWKYGSTLIRDSYFQTYAQELADDIGATNSEAAQSWPLTCIDWEQAARELQQDYTSVEFDGVTYWVR